MDIVLIEDDEIYADYIKKFLGQNPEYVISWFRSAEDYDKAGRSLADVYIVDFRLPGISGIDFFEKMKPRLKNETKLVIMSAIDDGAMVLDFIKRGVRDYVIKDEHVIESLRTILQGDEDYYLFE